MNQKQRDDLEDKIKDIYEDCNAEFRLGSRKFTDALASRIVAAMIVQSKFLFGVINHLVGEQGLYICVEAEGENLDDDQAKTINPEAVDFEGEFRTLEDPYKIYEQTQAVDECFLYVYARASKRGEVEDSYGGWIHIVNGNDEGEDICNYSITNRNDGCSKEVHIILDEYLDKHT